MGGAAVSLLAVVASGVGLSARSQAAAGAAPPAPRSYWRFEDETDPYADSRGAWAIGGKRPPLDPLNTTHWRDQADGGVVGGYLDFGFKDPAKLQTASRDWWEGNAGCVPFPCNATDRAIDGFTIEFLIKPGPWLFRGGGIQLFGELSYSQMPTVRLSGGEISFTAATRPPGGGVPPPRPPNPMSWDTLVVPLHGDGVTSSDYLADGQW